MNSRLTQLLNGYLDGNFTAVERAALLQLLSEKGSESDVKAFMDMEISKLPPAHTLSPSDANRVLRSVLQQQSTGTTPMHRIHFLRTAWFRYAVVLLLIAGTASILYFNNLPHKKTASQLPAEQSDILPGRNTAILTLANGRTIVLDSAGNGVLAQQADTKIVKLRDGALAYRGAQASAEALYNTISTPRGGQYQVVLPDGSKVWLNAASSVRFPAAFGKEREVTVTGEVYFEIAKDAARPFVVSASKTTINVLGTSFNINAYADEPSVRTTLLEGSVKVISSSRSLILQPGQQAESGQQIQINKTVDLGQVMAWKNGLFNFQNKKLDEVMRQLSRWYDIEVVYQKNIPSIEFVGEMSRNMKLSNMLKALKQSEVHFIMEGRKLTILP